MNVAGRSTDIGDRRGAISDRGSAETDDLVRLAQAGDVAAFEKLVARQYAFIFKTAFRWLGHRSDAEDVTQTVCLRLAAALRSFDGRASFTTWLYRITLNAVRDLQRSNKRRQRLATDVFLAASEEAPPTQEDEIALDDLWRIVRELPQKQCDAVLLVYGEHMSHAKAAAIMGCKEVTVAWHIHKARKALKERV